MQSWGHIIFSAMGQNNITLSETVTQNLRVFDEALASYVAADEPELRLWMKMWLKIKREARGRKSDLFTGIK